MQGEGGKVGLSSLSGIFKCAPLGMAYCLTKPGLALVQRQTAPPVCCPAPGYLIDTSAASARRLSHIYLLRLFL